MPSSMFQLDFDEAATNRGFANIKRAQSIAVKNTLNVQAALTRRGYIKNFSDQLIERNTFTRRNIRFEKTEARVISRMETRVGATEAADYMALQEEGGLRKSKSGKTLGIAQKAARGGSKRRTVLKANYLRKIQRNTVKWPTGKGTKRSRTVIAAKNAKDKNNFMNYGGNIYKITSFSSKNGRVRFRKKHLYNVSKQRTRVQGQPMLLPAALKAGRDGQEIYNSQVRKLLRQDKII